MTNHKHLRLAIEDIYSNENELTESLAFRLVNEFRYSNLFIPAKRDEYGLNFIIYGDGEMKLTPLFTDPDEFNKFFKNTDDIELMQNPFELYQNILKTTDIEGYILNPASEKYLFKREFLLEIRNIPKTNYYTTNAYSGEELKKLKDTKNESLESFLKDTSNVGNFEALFEEFASSCLFTMMVSDVDLQQYAKTASSQ